MNRNVFTLVLLSGLTAGLTADISSLAKRQFVLVDEMMTWTMAQSYCRANYLDLATVYNMEEAVLLTTIPVNNKSVWIGLKRAPKWSWGWSEGNNTLLDYSVWDQDQPRSFLCGAMDVMWRAVNCSSLFSFICYSGPRDLFYFVNPPKNWTDAQAYCRSQYTDLATISNPIIQNTISSLIGQRGPAWVGLFADWWAWSDSGNSSFRYWKSNAMQSLSSTSDCAALDFNLKMWTNKSCTTEMPFFCYKYELVQRRQVVEIKLSSVDKRTLKDPLVAADMLKQIKKKLLAQGLVGYTNMSWIENDSIVFHRVPYAKEEEYQCET